MLMYEFWYDYVKPKYGKRAKLCYIDTNQNISLYTQKQMIIKNILQKMLKQDLTLQIMYQNAVASKDCYEKGKIKK